MADSICKFCTKVDGRYTCPRCNVKYCSVACYNDSRHLQCTEDFFKDWVLLELKEKQQSSEVRSKIIEILNRVHKNESENEALDSDDDEAVCSLEERLASMDIDENTDADKLWSSLTSEEKVQFKKLMSDSSSVQLVPEWQPWWFKKLDLVQPISEEKETDKHPSIIQGPKLTEMLNKKKPASCLKYNLANVLYGYVFTVKIHNGCHIELAVEATDLLLQISNTLNDNQNFNDAETAIYSAIQIAREMKTVEITKDFPLSIINDIILIIEGPNPQNHLVYILAALSDLHHLLIAALKCGKSKGPKSEKSLNRKKLKLVEKKIEFLLSWTQEYGNEMMPLIEELKFLYELSNIHIKGVEKQKENVESFLKQKQKLSEKPLIEEIG